MNRTTRISSIEIAIQETANKSLSMMLIRIAIVGGIATCTTVASLLLLGSIFNENWKVSVKSEIEQLKMMTENENLWISCKTNVQGVEECSNFGFKPCNAPGHLTGKRFLVITAFVLSLTSAIMMVSDITLCTPKYVPHLVAGGITILAAIFAIAVGAWYMSEIEGENSRIRAENEATKGGSRLPNAGGSRPPNAGGSRPPNAGGSRKPFLYYASGEGVILSLAGGVFCLISGVLRIGYAIYQGKCLHEIK